jgi:hypothetical protein
VRIQAVERDAVNTGYVQWKRAENFKTKCEAIDLIVVVTLRHNSTLPKGVFSTTPHF